MLAENEEGSATAQNGDNNLLYLSNQTPLPPSSSVKKYFAGEEYTTVEEWNLRNIMPLITILIRLMRILCAYARLLWSLSKDKSRKYYNIEELLLFESRGAIWGTWGKGNF